MKFGNWQIPHIVAGEGKVCTYKNDAECQACEEVSAEKAMVRKSVAIGLNLKPYRECIP